MMWPKRFDLRRRAALWGVLAGGLLLTLVSCGSNGCEETRQAYCIVEMKATGSARITQLYVWGIGQMGQHVVHTDSVFTVDPETGRRDTTLVSASTAVDSLMYATTSPDQLELLLRPDTTETRLLFLATVRQEDETKQLSDTLTLLYDASPYFLDMECGCSIRYQLHGLSSTHHLIRDARITNDIITNTEHVNIRIEY